MFLFDFLGFFFFFFFFLKILIKNEHGSKKENSSVNSNYRTVNFVLSKTTLNIS